MRQPNTFSVDKFVARFEVDPETGCHVWTGARDKQGYGVIRISGNNYGTHRIAHAIFRRDPGKLFVCHSCDNPPCGNPEHLFLGTRTDNCRDMWRKGRGAGYSRKNARRRLSDEQVVEIIGRYASGVTGAELAARFDVSPQYVRDLAIGRKRKAAYALWIGSHA